MSEQATTEAPALQRAPKRVPPRAEREAARPPADAKAPAGDMPKPTDGGLSQDDPRRPGFVRQPFGTTTLKLRAPKRPGYHRHWFNDYLDRIQDAKKAGYVHVTEEGSKRPMTRVVGTSPFGGPMKAYLMEIPKEWFEADMAAGQKPADEIARAIRGGDIARKDGDERYVPNQGRAIKVEDD